MTRGRRAHAGFTYLLALMSVAAISAVVAATLEVWSTTRQREKEAELAWTGNQFRQAIGLYYERTPGPVKKYPESIEALLLDSRFPSKQRYLRRIYSDPLTGKADWIPIIAPEGGVMGVRSAATAAPVNATAARNFVYMGVPVQTVKAPLPRQ